jgi:hypothetical protein
MRRGFSVLLVLGVALIRPTPAQNVSGSPPADGPQAYTVTEAYSVYTAILGAHGIGRFVNLETDPHEMCRAPGSEPDPSMRAAMVDYVKVNHSKFILLPIFFGLFAGSKSFKLVLRQELPPPVDTEIAIDLWSFSAVGFNRDKNLALTYYEHAGTGGILVLQKIGGKWVQLESKTMCRWIA